MSFFTRALRAIAPEAALKREIAGKKLNALRSFEAAGRGPRLDGWGLSKKPEVLDTRTLRERARFLVRNNPYAAAGLRALSGYCIGPGIKPHSSNKLVDKALKQWADGTLCDYFGEQNLYGLQATAFAHLAVDGEVFVQKVVDEKSSLPVKLRLVEADRLDDSKTQGNIIAGIEYDKNSRRVAYYFYENTASAWPKFPQSKRIPADEIIHIYRKDTAFQTRGVSWFAPVILRLKDFDEYEDAELLRQKIAACFVGFYRDLEPQGDDPFSDKNGIPHELRPGSIMSAPSGQTIEFANPPQPVTYASYAESAKLTIASGLGVPYMMLSSDYSKANYSSSRMAMLNFHRYVKSIQDNTILPRLKEVEQWLLETLNLKGVSTSQDPYVWAVPPREFVDPLKDVEAYREAVSAGFRSHSDVIRELGSDPADVYDEIAENNKDLKKLGINIFSEESGGTNQPKTRA